MGLFFDILSTVTLPVALIMGVGWLAQRHLELHAAVLGRILVNIALPCALFNFLTTAELPLLEAWPTAWFTILQFLSLAALGWGIASVLGVEPEIRPVIGLACAFANTGNFGIPVAQLAFPADLLLHQTIIVSLHSILIVPAGLVFLAGQRRGLWESLRAVFLSPMILAVLLGLVVKGLEIDPPFIVSHPINLVAQAYIFLALLTLGAQLAETKFSLNHGPVWLVVALKMLVAPALTWLVLIAVGFEPEVTDLIVVAAAAPVGLLVAIFCTVYGRRPEVASAMVLMTTVLSPFTVTAWILVSRLF